MSGGHYREECEHGIVVGQCRCPSRDKAVHLVSCSDIRDHDERLATLVTPTPTLEVGWVDAAREGPCNFCNRASPRVLAVKGNSLTVRFCPTCLHDVAFFERT